MVGEGKDWVKDDYMVFGFSSMVNEVIDLERGVWERNRLRVGGWGRSRSRLEWRSRKKI